MSDQKGSDDKVSPSDHKGSDKANQNQSGPTPGDNTESTETPPRTTPAGSSTGARSDSQISGPPRATGTGQPHSGGNGPSRPGGKDRARSGGKGLGLLAVLALLVALIALIAAGWLWYRGQQRLAAFNDRVDTVEVALESSVQDVVLPRLSQLQGRIESQASTNASQRETLATMQERLEATRLELSGLLQRLEGGDRRWQLLQIEDLLLTANRRLQLYNAPSDARAALKLANEAIANLNDPRLFKVRSRIVNGIAALNALPDPDVEGLALSLNAFIDQVPALPLASDVPDEYQSESGQAASDQAGGADIDLSSGWRHFLDSVGNALQQMVTIRRADGTQRALLPPDQVYFLRQNLLLKLQGARLALLNGNSEVYRASLASAVDWLQQYYVTDDPAVAAMIDRLNQMQNVKLDWQAPDISGSLIALRNYMRARGQEEPAGSESAANRNQPGETPAALSDQGDVGADSEATAPSGQGSE